MLARATLDGSRISAAAGSTGTPTCAPSAGPCAAQGAASFARDRLALEVGGYPAAGDARPPRRGCSELTGPADGLVEQASFSFRGDPENWLAADLWLAGRATDFRWGQRRWESLEIAEPSSPTGACRSTGSNCARAATGSPSTGNVPCRPTRRPSGRRAAGGRPGSRATSTPGSKTSASPRPAFRPARAARRRAHVRSTAGSARGPGTQGFDGYLNVEGSALTLRGAPLDYLRSTLVFRGEELDVADLQATHDGDYLAGRGSLRLTRGRPDFQALGRVSIKDLGVSTTPAYADLLPWADAGGAPVRALTAGVAAGGQRPLPRPVPGRAGGQRVPASVGSVDVRDAANPVCDLALTGEQPPRMADPADADALWRAGALLRADPPRPPDASGATIRGGVQLVHGHFDRPEQLHGPRAGGGSSAHRLLRAAPAPVAGGVARLAAGPARHRRRTHCPAVAHTGRAGEVQPALEVTGTRPAIPRLGGTLEFRPAGRAGSRRAAPGNFSPGAPDHSHDSGSGTPPSPAMAGRKGAISSTYDAPSRLRGPGSTKKDRFLKVITNSSTGGSVCRDAHFWPPIFAIFSGCETIRPNPTRASFALDFRQIRYDRLRSANAPISQVERPARKAPSDP